MAKDGIKIVLVEEEEKQNPLIDAEPVKGREIVGTALAAYPDETPTERMMRIALESNNIEALEKMIALKNQEEDRSCKKDFDLHFAEMQKEFTPIVRSVKGQFGMYAPLEKMTEKYGPIMSRHGITYWWEVEPERITIGEKSFKRTYIVLAGYGHERRKTFFDAPELKPNAAQNELQAAGVEDTYSHRYTFKAGLGIAEIGEDADGAILNFEDGMKYGDYQLVFENCKTIDELKDAWIAAHKELEGDEIGKKVVVELRHRRADEIKKEIANGGNK